jgi:carboxymethylenebutenolidase
MHHAALDERVAETIVPFAKALRDAKKPLEFHVYKGANHAFNNDTSAERYNKEAADLAWARTLAFFKRYLG